MVASVWESEKTARNWLCKGQVKWSKEAPLTVWNCVELRHILQLDTQICPHTVITHRWYWLMTFRETYIWHIVCLLHNCWRDKSVFWRPCFHSESALATASRWHSSQRLALGSHSQTRCQYYYCCYYYYCRHCYHHYHTFCNNNRSCIGNSWNSSRPPDWFGSICTPHCTIATFCARIWHNQTENYRQNQACLPVTSARCARQRLNETKFALPFLLGKMQPVSQPVCNKSISLYRLVHFFWFADVVFFTFIIIITYCDNLICAYSLARCVSTTDQKMKSCGRNLREDCKVAEMYTQSVILACHYSSSSASNVLFNFGGSGKFVWFVLFMLVCSLR
jgi:hypothetical protein